MIAWILLNLQGSEVQYVTIASNVDLWDIVVDVRKKFGIAHNIARNIDR